MTNNVCDVASDGSMTSTKFAEAKAGTIFVLLVLLMVAPYASASEKAFEIYQRFQNKMMLLQAIKESAIRGEKPPVDTHPLLVSHEARKLVDELGELAKQGDLDAQYLFATIRYTDGKVSNNVVPGNEHARRAFTEAEKWFRAAAARESADAAFELARMYANGDGVVASTYAAVEWFYKAGELYLKQNERELALTALESINNLAPDHFLAKQLFSKIYKKPVGEAKEASFGTGWLCATGFVVTNHHVVKGYKKITLIRTDGVRIPASVVLSDRLNDLALLRADKSSLRDIYSIPLARERVRIGANVFTIGYPHPDVMGVKPKLTDGVISAVTGLGDDPRTYQITVPVQAGNSGGPLLNMKGEVIGVVTSKLSAVEIFKWTGDLPQNVNYAVKVPYLKALLDSVRSHDSRITRLPRKPGTLEELAARIQNSVMMVIAE